MILKKKVCIFTFVKIVFEETLLAFEKAELFLKQREEYLFEMSKLCETE